MMIRHGYPTFWRIGLMALLAFLTVACGGSGSDKPASPASVLSASFTQQVSGLDVSLDASASTGNIASYQWDFGDGATGSGKTASHSYAAAGTYTVALTVTDNQAATASKSVSVVVGNVVPSAAFTHNEINLVASFDASGSSDSDGSIASYSWDFGDGATGTGKTSSHSYAAAGTYTVTLTVTDDQGATASQSASISVLKANVAPTAAFSHSAKELVASFDASASSDSDGSIASYSWSFGDGATGTGKTASHSYTAAGTYTVTLTVTDDKGATASQSASVSVVAANVVPTAAFTHGETDLLVSVDASSSSDSDGSIASYSWSFGDGATGSGKTASHSYAAAGTYSVTLTVTDDKGAMQQETQTLVVNSALPLITGVVVDDAVAGAKVTVFDAETGVELGETVTASNGSFSITPSQSAEHYLVTSSGGNIGSSVFSGTMSALCDANKPCDLTPYTSLIYKASYLYSSEQLLARYNKAKVHIDTALNLSVDPFISSVLTSVDLSLIRNEIKDGIGVDTWLDVVLTDISDGYVDSSSLQKQFPAYKHRIVESQPVEIDIDDVKQTIAKLDPTIDGDAGEKRTYKVVSFQSDGSEFDATGGALQSEGYLTSSALIEYTDSFLSDGTDLSSEKTIYLGFDRGQWKGKHDATTTILSRLFLSNPQWLFLPDDEQVALAQKAISSVNFANCLSAFEQSLSGYAFDENAFDESVSQLKEDLLGQVSINQIAITNRLFFASLRHEGEKIKPRMLSNMPNPLSLFISQALASDDVKANKFSLMPSVITGGIFLQQQVGADGMTFMQNMNVYNNTAIYYSLDKEVDYLSDCGFDTIFRPAVIEPNKNGLVNFPIGSTAVNDVAVNTPLVLYSSSRCPIDQPTIMNTILVVSVSAKAFPAGGLGLGSILKSLASKMPKVKATLEKTVGTYEKYKQEIGLVYSGLKIATTAYCDIQKSYGDSTGKYQSCLDYIDSTDKILNKILSIKPEITEDEASQQNTDDARKIYNSFVRPESTSEEKFGVLAALSNSKSIVKREFIVHSVKYLFDTMYGKGFSDSVDGRKYNSLQISRYLVYRYYIKDYIANSIHDENKRRMNRDIQKILWRMGKQSYTESMDGSGSYKVFSELTTQIGRITTLFTVYEKIQAGISAGKILPDQHVIKEVSLFFLDEMKKNIGITAGKVSLDIIIGLTPAQLGKIALSVNQLIAIGWDAITKPSEIMFTLEQGDSPRFGLKTEVPALSHLRYLTFPASSNGYLLSAPLRPEEGVWLFDEANEAKSLTLSIESKYNNILVMPGVTFEVENQAGFSDEERDDVRNFILNVPDASKAVTIDWHSYRHDHLDTNDLDYSYPRNMSTAFSGSYFMDYIQNSKLDCPEGVLACIDDALYLRKDKKSANAIQKNYMEYRNLDSMQFIDFSSLYNEKHSGGVRHNTPGIYTDGTDMIIGDAKYSNRFNVYVAIDYDYATDNAKSHRDVIASQSKKIVNDNNQIIGFMVSASRPDYFNYWGRNSNNGDREGIEEHPFRVIVQYTDGSTVARSGVWLNGQDNYIPIAREGNNYKSVASIIVYDSILQGFIEQSGGILSQIIHNNMQRTEGGHYSRPFAVITPAELVIQKSDEWADSDHDGLVDPLDKWPNNPDYLYDLDADGIADEWEDLYGLDPLAPEDASGDLDNDGQTNLQEFINGTDPGRAAFKLTGAVGDGQLTLNWPTQGSATPISLCVAQEPISDPYNCLTASGSSTRTLAAVTAPYTLSGLSNSQRYYLVLLAEPASGAPYVSSSLDLVPVKASLGKLNDTGITRCADASSWSLPCPVTDFPGQDAESGRDVSANDDSDGHAGFSFTKVSSSGEALAASAPEWSCVKDNVTGLLWEIHTDDGGLRDKDNTYSWYNPDATTNGGHAGTQNGGQCSGGISCDTEGYVDAVNAAGLCGYHDWRLPTVLELQGLVDYSIPYPGPTIDTNFFPDTQQNVYWSSSAEAGSSYDAWSVSFNGGYTYWYVMSSYSQLRLVRSGQ